jgi:hypothetical protein
MGSLGCKGLYSVTWLLATVQSHTAQQKLERIHPLQRPATPFASVAPIVATSESQETEP